MDKEQEFLSEQEIEELRREIDALVANADLRGKIAQEGAQGDGTEDFLDSLDPLSMTDNGSYVRVDPDHMQAFIFLTPPDEEKGNYTKEELLDFLLQKGVTTGYHQSNLAAIVKKRIYQREILAACGKRVIPSEDGHYEYMVSPEQYRAPEVRPDGSVDYASMNTLENVKEGDVVAVYHHGKVGQDGYDIYGNTIPAGNAKELPQLKGKVVRSPENPDIYLAAKDGKIEIKNGHVDIQTVHEINGEVTLITGRIECVGDVMIHGSVESGVVIRAGRNIEIRGAAEAVSLEAGGDVILCHGIQGANKAKIMAQGNVFADFIEQTNVEAGGSIQANVIMNANISSDGQVILTGRKGAIIGGYTHAKDGIKATEVGNTAEVRTVLHAGCTKDFYRQTQVYKKKNTELSRQVKDMSEELVNLRKKSKDSELLLKKLKMLEAQYRPMKAELEEVRAKFQEMEKIIAQTRESEIVISGNVYRGTLISFGVMQIPIERSTCFMKYYPLGGMIESSVIVYS